MPAGGELAMEVAAVPNPNVAAELTMAETTIAGVEAMMASPAEEATRPEKSSTALGGSSEEEEQSTSSMVPRMKHTADFKWQSTEAAEDFPDRAGFIREVIFRKLGLAAAQVVCILRNRPQRFVDVTVLTHETYQKRDVDLLPGHRDIRDEFGIWNGRRQFHVHLRPPTGSIIPWHILTCRTIGLISFTPSSLPSAGSARELTMMENKIDVVETAVEMAAGTGEGLGKAEELLRASPAPTLAEILKQKKEDSTPKKKKKSEREATVSEGGLLPARPNSEEGRERPSSPRDGCRVGPAQFPVDVSESTRVVRGRTGDAKLGGVSARGASEAAAAVSSGEEELYLWDQQDVTLFSQKRREYVEVLPGHEDMRDKLGFWNGKRQFWIHLLPDSQGCDGFRHPPATFNLVCQGFGHTGAECTNMRCNNCLERGHMAKDCKGLRMCNICGAEDHLAHTCSQRKPSYADAVSGRREKGMFFQPNVAEEQVQRRDT
ncbi:hypothetical protein Z043_125309 [Scleropages formosus]|uniref:CCHC-type domain-containing protein n=1 Tax=Scleropages formosus TaxID=113540 RepID=A0A0P7TTX4_SCLFO|nr:hypothetical protein Z043_125309 [Scleropages formosus]